MTLLVTPRAVAFVRRHPRTAQVGLAVVVGAAAAGGAGLSVGAAIYAERVLQRRAAR